MYVLGQQMTSESNRYRKISNYTASLRPYTSVVECLLTQQIQSRQANLIKSLISTLVTESGVQVGSVLLHQYHPIARWLPKTTLKQVCVSCKSSLKAYDWLLLHQSIFHILHFISLSINKMSVHYNKKILKHIQDNLIQLFNNIESRFQ